MLGRDRETEKRKKKKKDRERERLYDIAYVWNIKATKKICEYNIKVADSQIQRRN